MTVPGAKLTVPVQRGLLEVYWLEDNATAFAVAQFPNAELLPTSLMVWPYEVVTTSLKVTATEVGSVHEVDFELEAVEVVLELVALVEVVAALVVEVTFELADLTVVVEVVFEMVLPAAEVVELVEPDAARSARYIRCNH